MGIFSTREIATIIYGILLFVYVLVRNKQRAIFLPVIKAACHKKLIIPFGLILLFAACFVLACTYLPFWDWIYLKDIVFWVLFAGVPICFNATGRQLDDHYFRDILKDNLTFTALVEFITGTFTFSFIGELVMQPLLIVLMILQSSLVKKTESAKKVLDGIVGIVGLIIIGLTIKSIVDAIGDISFVDIIVGITLPIILSIIYLPIAYFFALYAKYELLFLRMGFKEPDDKKLRYKHRIQVIRLCKFSYKKVRRFLYEYVPKMYTRMSVAEFENIIDEFRGTTEHTYTVVIRYDRKYYISRTFGEDHFAFHEYTINKGGLFNSQNKALRKEIALQIQANTPFKNTEFNDSNLYYPVSLRRMFLFKKGSLFKRTKIAIFVSNSFERKCDSVDLPYEGGVKDQSDSNAIILMRAMKLNNYWSIFLVAFFGFTIFLWASFKVTKPIVNLDLAVLVYTILCELQILFGKQDTLLKVKIKKKIIYLYKDIMFNGVQEILVFLFSLYIGYLFYPLNINSELLAKFSIAILFLSVMFGIIKRDQ